MEIGGQRPAVVRVAACIGTCSETVNTLTWGSLVIARYSLRRCTELFSMYRDSYSPGEIASIPIQDSSLPLNT